MKRKWLIVGLLLTMTLSLFFGFTACKEKPIELSSPENLRVEKRVLVWDKVDHATGYAIFINGKEYEATENSFSLHFLCKSGDYNLRLMALGNGKKYDDSDWTETQITLEAPIAHGYDENGYELFFIEEELGYSLSRGKADLTGDITLPDTYDDYPVIGIKKNAFVFMTGLYNYPNPITGERCNIVTTGIKLPNNLRFIESNTFAYMWGIEEIIIPDTVTEIGIMSFSYCKNLKRVGFPKGLKQIMNGAFESTALEEIDFPEGLEVIGDRAFYNEIDERANFHVSSSLSEIEIPDSVTYIEKRAFEGRENLRKITMSKNIKRMEERVFEDTAWYEAQADGIVYLGEDVIYKYKGEAPPHTQLEIKAPVKLIAGGAFRGQDNLEKVVIGEGVKLGGSLIFLGCDVLKEAELPSDLSEIPSSTFSGSGLERIELPSSLTKIERSAFAWTNLERIVIPANVKVLDDWFKECKNLKEVVLPEGLEQITGPAFLGCTSLTKVTIPSTVNYIGGGATFSGCTALTNIEFKNPNGWTVYDGRDEDFKEEIPASDLSNPATAILYFNDTYLWEDSCWYYWERS